METKSWLAKNKWLAAFIVACVLLLAAVILRRALSGFRRTPAGRYVLPHPDGTLHPALFGRQCRQIVLSGREYPERPR